MSIIIAMLSCSMSLRKYTNTQIISNAKKYKYKIDWKNKSPNFYSAAVRRNLIKNATIHMTRPPSHKIKWIKKIVLKDAKKYNSKSEWMKNSNSSYNSAKKNLTTTNNKKINNNITYIHTYTYTVFLYIRDYYAS